MICIYLFWDKYPAYRSLFITWDLIWLAFILLAWAVSFVLPTVALFMQRPMPIGPALLFSLYTISFAALIIVGVKLLWKPWSPWKNK